MPLGKLQCTHKTHRQVGGKGEGGEYTSADSSKYPAQLNQWLVDAITGEDSDPVVSSGGLQHDATILGWDIVEGAEPRAIVDPDLLFGP